VSSVMTVRLWAGWPGGQPRSTAHTGAGSPVLRHALRWRSAVLSAASWPLRLRLPGLLIAPP
jgi:hypothetical protein